ncbi:hypothetical protein F8S13_23795 [Chloroflexia bacterium SDU3-3]|nr:hypothetical protein F8S13_23795 [Chloroflexia bacterium SDU3-3]
MRRLTFGLVLLLMLASTLAGADTPAAARGGMPQQISRASFVGMVVRDPFYEFGSDPANPAATNAAFQDEMGRMLAMAGVQWVRLEIHLGDDVQGDLAKHDYFINTVAPRHGFKVLALLAFDVVRDRNLWDLNCLQAECMVGGSKYGGGVNSFMQQWLDRSLMVADRYGSRIAAYEVLNEQNRLPPSGLGIEPTITGRLMTKFYRFCHGIGTPAGESHGCGQSQIVLGGLHPRGTGDPTKPSTIKLTDAQYLAAIYSDPSSFASFYKSYGYYPLDGVGYHPYPEEVRLSLPRQVYVDTGIQRMLKVLDAYDPSKPLWITEIGYNLAFAGNDPSQLGAFVRDIYTTLAQQPRIANVFWFKYEDFAPAEGSNAQKWGMVRIPFTADASRPDGVRYQAQGQPAEVRTTFSVLRELTGTPLFPARAYLPMVAR